MAQAVILPRQGQSVETCYIVAWKKAVGDVVAEGDILCEVETDKATFEVESTAAGTLLEIFYPEGEDAPVLVNLCAVGAEGDDVSALRPDGAAEAAAPAEAAATLAEAAPEPASTEVPAPSPTPTQPTAVAENNGVSPRARKLAEKHGIDASALTGTGPKGRVIERDVDRAVSSGAIPTRAAKDALAAGGVVPQAGTGIGGRALASDVAARSTATEVVVQAAPGQITEIPLRGVRKLIAERMYESIRTTAQLTLNASADARAVLALRKRFKNTPEEMGLNKVSVNDIVMFGVAKTLPQFPALNALLENNTIYQYSDVHLAFAVDTERGLMVPVARNANHLSMKQLSGTIKQLAMGCIEGGILPDQLQGGTFTVSNLGAMGVENFTPILNPPQVAILGIGKADLKPVMVDGEVQFIPHMALSLTINHQVVDGAPGARFLQALSKTLANIDLYMAI